jgi:hypothetical protein
VLRFLNPWVILGVLLAIAGAGGLGYYKGNAHARTAALAEAAKQMTLEEKIQTTIATEVSKIKVTNTTLKQTIQGKTVEVPVYRDCRHDPVVLGLLNDLLTGKQTAKPASGLVVPAADSVD